MNAAPMGVPNQHATTFPIPATLSSRLKKPIPTIAPTAAWEVDTGSPMVVIIVTVIAAPREQTTANLRSRCVRPASVSIPALPSTTAPIRTKAEARKAAVENLSILDDTAEPNTLAASW